MTFVNAKKCYAALDHLFQETSIQKLEGAFSNTNHDMLSVLSFFLQYCCNSTHNIPSFLSFFNRVCFHSSVLFCFGADLPDALLDEKVAEAVKTLTAELHGDLPAYDENANQKECVKLLLGQGTTLCRLFSSILTVHILYFLPSSLLLSLLMPIVFQCLIFPYNHINSQLPSSYFPLHLLPNFSMWCVHLCETIMFFSPFDVMCRHGVRSRALVSVTSEVHLVIGGDPYCEV